MKKNDLKPALVMALVSAIVVSCTQDKVEMPDTSSAAFHIAESEKLVIPAAIKLPDDLPKGNSRVATFFADGVQKYKAQEIPNSNPVAYQWVFVAPLADLYDATNNKVGNHSAGPTWQLSTIDSMFGQAFSPPRTSPAAESNNIDWLLLMPRTGKPPTGFFADVSYVQRIATNGGQAPPAPPTNASETSNVRYTAIYRFSKKNL